MRKLGSAFCLLVLLLTLPAPARAVDSGPGQFVVRCPYSHTLPDDPIVFPGQPGASHMHDFFGNKSTDASSTTESMLASESTCRAASDTAGYWTPTASLNGQQIKPGVMRIYYLGRPDVEVETIPPGLQMLGGNKLATTPEENPAVRWYCGETETVKTPRLTQPYDCTPWASQYHFVDGIIAIIDLPSCWDGIGLTPEDVAYRGDGGCPAEFAHPIPQLSERVHYHIMNPLNPDGTMALTLSSGPFYTMHADFWNTWQQERLDQLVETCLDAHVRCRSIDAEAEIQGTAQFGTSRYDVATSASADDQGLYVAGFTNYRLPGQLFHHRSDMFVRAYDPFGNVRWTRQVGTSGTDQALAVAAAADGVYVGGFTDGGLAKQEAKGGDDVVVAKFGVAGRELWIRQFGTPKDDRATAIVLGQGGVYVAGTTSGALNRGHASGGIDAFVAKLTSTGGTAWLRQFGSSGTDQATGLSTWGPRVYVAGSTDGALVPRVSPGGSDAFLRQMRGDGTVDWTRQFGTAGNDFASSVSSYGQWVYVSGSTDGAFPKATSAGGLDAFVRQFDQYGTPVWTDQFGSPADDDAVSVVSTVNGAYVAGSTLGALPDQTLLGESDAFVRKYLPGGTPTWTLQFGTIDYDRVYGSALEEGGVAVVGTTHGIFEGQTYAGDRDAFVTDVRFT